MHDEVLHVVEEMVAAVAKDNYTPGLTSLFNLDD
jgi:hypothetical protein